jgi:hypothetical protein
MLDSTRRHGNGHDALFSGGQHAVPAYRLNSACAIVIVRFDSYFNRSKICMRYNRICVLGYISHVSYITTRFI